MALDLNINPYYDDFDEHKNYHKILFKPTNAIQARELTQIQTILQDQIKKLGKFVLSEGSKVYGAQIFNDYNIISVKLTISDNTLSNIYLYKNKYVVGATSKLAGYITDIDYINAYLYIKPINSSATNNFESKEILNIFDTQELALAYTINDLIEPYYTETVGVNVSSIVNNATGSQYNKNLSINTLGLEIGDVLTSTLFTQSYTITDIIDGYTCVVDKTFEIDFTNIQLTNTKYASNIVLEIGIGDGVFFTNGYLVKNLAQSIVPNPKTRFPSAVVGFEVREKIVDFIDDDTLLDPALGASNYSSPGADRYVIELVLVSKPLIDDVTQELTDERFIEMVRVKRGEIIKSNLNPILGELEKTLARQMYDHAGSFSVEPFRLSFSQLELKSSSNTLNFSISPGKAYVFGHEFETTYQVNIQADKARDTNKVTNYSLSTYYGNSIQIKDLYGSINFQNYPTIELHSVTSGQNANTKLGEAQARNIKYLAENDYNLYLFDIKLNKSSSIANVKSLVTLTTANSYSSFRFSANSILSSSNTTVLVDPSNDSLVYKYPHNYVTNITNIEYDSNIFVNKNFTSNSISIFSGDLSRQILGGSGEVPSELKKQYFRIITKSTNGSYLENQEIDLDDTSITISQSTSDYIATISLINGKSYAGFVEIMYTVHNTNAKPKLKTLNKNQFVCVNATGFITSLKYSDIYKVNGVYKLQANTTAEFKGTWSSATSYNAGEYVSLGSSLYKSSVQSSGISPETNSSIWVKQTSLLTGYSINTGQKTSYYDHGSLVLKENFGVYVVNFDYFSHSSGGFLSQASYTVPYGEIPSTNINGISISLRDCLDFRPRRQDLSLTLVFDSYEIPATTFSSCFSDYEYYLSRIDKFVLGDNKKFKIIKGVPKLNPVPPVIPENSLNLATIFYGPYGYISDDINFRYDDHRRYTMDDIGILDKRITRNEYYTTLTMSESGVLNKSGSDALLSQRLNSGFFVDSFEDIRLADFYNPQCLCTIDVAKELSKPRMKVNPVKLQVDEDSIPINGAAKQIYYLPYKSEIVISNILATNGLTVNPFSKSTFDGILTIFPEQDIWIDTITAPIINSGTDSSYKTESGLDSSYKNVKPKKILKHVTIPNIVETQGRISDIDRSTGKLVVTDYGKSLGYYVDTNGPSDIIVNGPIDPKYRTII